MKSFVIFASILSVWAATAAEAKPVARSLRALRVAETNLAFGTRFDVNAIITSFGRVKESSFYVQDDEVGMICWDHTDVEPSAIRVGDRVRISGCLNPGKNSRIAADCDRIAVLAHGPLPEPLVVSPQDLARQKHEYILIRIQGILTDVFADELDKNVIYFVLNCDGNLIYGHVGKRYAPPDFAEKIGSAVSVTGIYGKPLGLRRQIKKTISVCYPDSIVEVRAKNLDSTPVLDIDETNFFWKDERTPATRRKAEGTVVAVWDRNNVLIQTASKVFVKGELAVHAKPRFGQSVQLIGLPETDLYCIILTRATWQPLAASDPATPLPPPNFLTASRLMSDDTPDALYDYSFHGKPVRLTGVVRGLPIPDGDGILYLENEGRMVRVDTSSVPDVIRDVETGSTVDVTGTCIMEIGKVGLNGTSPHITDYRIVTRIPGDIRVIKRPPWWTPVRLVTSIVLLLLVIVGFVVWNIVLRRIAERRSQELLNERLAHVESELKVGERTRLSVELHDTLSQNLVGAAMEINTAEQLVNDADALKHLNIASKTLKSTRNELRNCLWDLRSQALEEPDMNSAIRKTLEPYVSDVDLQVRFNVPREAFTDNMAHTLMRIIRELVLNAIRHGHAKTVKIAGGRENGWLVFSVRDDGIGFNPNEAPGIRQGHFGLQGVRERLRLIKGRVDVESIPGKGTHVSARFLLPADGKEKI